jgi:DNA-binding protein HU-beta
MNKAALAARMAKDIGGTQVDALRALSAFIDHVSKALKKGEKVKLVGFGTFSVFRRKAREGRNPQTGSLIKIAARRAARFTAGKDLRKLVEESPGRSKRSAG